MHVPAGASRRSLAGMIDEARALVAAGELAPTARQIRIRFGIGQDLARPIRDAILST